MELKLFNKYLIKSDELQFILYIKRPNREFEIFIDDKGNKRYSNFFSPSYHGKFYQVIDAIKGHEIRNSRATILSELKEDLVSIDKRIKKIQEEFNQHKE